MNVRSTFQPGRAFRPAFTLIELLVVVAIIGLLIAILMPSLRQIRGQARRAVCLNNLHQIGVGTYHYVNSSNDLLPDPYILGRHGYRQAPGTRTPNDPAALPEVYGMAAAMEISRSLPRGSEVWICPDQAEWMEPYKNSYAFSFNHPGYDFNPPRPPEYWGRKYSTLLMNVKRKYHIVDGKEVITSTSLADSPWVWDNYNFKPALTGFFGPFKLGYSIPADQQIYPHNYMEYRHKRKYQAVNMLYLDMHVAPRYRE